MQAFDSTTYSGRLRIIEAYRTAVAGSAGRITFKRFCDDIGISDYRKVLWWCQGHKISVMSIRTGREQRDEQASPTIVRLRPASTPESEPAASPTLSDVGITFPNGVKLALGECSVENVVCLVTAYSSRSAAGGL